MKPKTNQKQPNQHSIITVLATAGLKIMLLVSLCIPISSAAQTIRVNTFHSEDRDAFSYGTDFFKTTNSWDYTFSLGATNVTSTNTSSLYAMFGNLTNLTGTKSWQWDVATDTLSQMFHLDWAWGALDGSGDTGGYDDNGNAPLVLPPDQNGRYKFMKTPWADITPKLDLLLTDGDPNDIQTNLYAIKVDAVQHGSPIPGSEIKIGNDACNADGYVFKMLPNLSTNDITPIFGTNYTNVSFTISVSLPRAEIQWIQGYFQWDYDENQGNILTNLALTRTNWVADQTNSVWAGEKMNLTLILLDYAGNVISGAPLTNWAWTVDGLTCSNYTATQAVGRRDDAYPFDQATCSFYWYATNDAAIVQCVANLAGQAVVANAWFNVRLPLDRYFSITKSGDIAVDVGVWHPEDSNFAIHWGGPSTNSPGFIYSYPATILTNFGIAQVVASTVAKLYIEPDPTNYPGIYVWVGKQATNVLDADFPYPDNFDSPGQYCAGIMGDRNDKFSDTLMFNPRTPDSIWVPTYIITIAWNASCVINFDPFSGLISYLLSPGSDATITPPTETDQHPIWQGTIDEVPISVFAP